MKSSHDYDLMGRTGYYLVARGGFKVIDFSSNHKDGPARLTSEDFPDSLHCGWFSVSGEHLKETGFDLKSSNVQVRGASPDCCQEGPGGGGRLQIRVSSGFLDVEQVRALDGDRLLS
ncbi:hypothetical protein B296_00027283 [Ensete ventricosum]|uniref:Uncharacterized protein n=1 Tax=Ensete ventricosum TaxID=4639 RepID=A0A427AQ07_ENSVE|nr:hypothetical protein B296_00027283 [Ensete ventricosum]